MELFQQGQELGMRNKKLYYLLLLLLLIPGFLYSIGVLYPEKYCIEGVCFKKPKYYNFKMYVSSSDKQTALCALTFSCKNSFSFDNGSHFNTIIFNNAIGNHFGLVFNKI